jgi:hypothetical protein
MGQRDMNITIILGLVTTTIWIAFGVAALVLLIGERL